MAANLYARSIFGEDALANLSIERSSNQPDSTVTGHIRIRAKSQVSVDGIVMLKPSVIHVIRYVIFMVRSKTEI